MFSIVAFYFLVAFFGLIPRISSLANENRAQNSRLVKNNLLALLIYSFLLFGLMVMLENNWKSTSYERGWPDIIPAIFFLVWSIAFSIHLLVVWIIMEVRARSSFKKSN